MIETEQIGEVRRFRMARTILGRGIYFTGAYLVDGLMVDTGCVYSADELARSVSGLQVRMVVNTHSHEDHVGANAALQARFNADLFAHPEALPYLADPRKRRLKPYQIFFWGYPHPSNGQPLGEVIETDRYRFQVIHTPGHSPDHVCLYEPNQRWLFTGDAYVGGKDRALRRDFHIWQIIDSLKKLAALGAETLFTGSGTVRRNGHEELVNKIAYLEDMGGRVLDLLKQGWSYRGICRKLLGPEMWITYITQGNYSGMNLVRSYIEEKPDSGRI